MKKTNRKKTTSTKTKLVLSNKQYKLITKRIKFCEFLATGWDNSTFLGQMNYNGFAFIEIYYLQRVNGQFYMKLKSFQYLIDVLAHYINEKDSELFQYIEYYGNNYIPESEEFYLIDLQYMHKPTMLRVLKKALKKNYSEELFECIKELDKIKDITNENVTFSLALSIKKPNESNIKPFYDTYIYAENLNSRAYSVRNKIYNKE